MKTLSQLVTEFRQIIDQPNEAVVTSAMANREINKAAKELYGLMIERNNRYFLTSSTISTTAATAFVNYPSDCVIPNKLLDSDMVILPHKDLELFDYDEDTGEPTCWDTVGQRFMFSPVPDATYTYTVYYTYMPDDMVASTSTPMFPVGYEGIIALKAAINIKMIKEEAVRETIQYEYATSLKALLNIVGSSQSGASRRVINSTHDMGDF